MLHNKTFLAPATDQFRGTANSLFRAYKKQKAQHICWAFAGYKSLTMSYFHTGIRTIIGAEAFHCPVRDGKEWDHLAMVIRHNWLSPCQLARRRIHRVQISFLIAYLA
jgi:hypothetical protein